MSETNPENSLRRVLRLAISLSCALVLSAAPSFADDDEGEPAPPACRNCKSTGLVVCDEHRKDEVAHELGALYCSEFADCEPCGGAGWLDCEECEYAPVEEWLQARLALQAAPPEEFAEWDQTMQRPVRKAQSAHMRLVWEIERIKIGRKNHDGHEALHVYLDRMETLFSDYCALLEVGEGEFQKHISIFVWALSIDQELASRTFLENQNENGVKMLGATPMFTVCGNRANFRGDEELHRSLVHNVTHLLLSHQAPIGWMGNVRGGWADAGLAHWFEDRYFELCDNYCYQEQNSNVDFRGGVWRPAVRRMVSKDDAPTIATLFTRNTDTLTLEEHAVAFSVIDHLQARGGPELNRVLRRLRTRTPTRDALREVYGLSVLELEEEWKQWVLDTYPTR